MGIVDIQKLQKIVADLASRVESLEDYVDILRRKLAENDIIVPRL